MPALRCRRRMLALHRIGQGGRRGGTQTNFAHVNNDADNRPQFSQVDAYTAGATGANPMLVLVAFNDDVHTGCTQNVGGQDLPLYPQPPYNVGILTAPTTLVSSGSFGTVNFTSAIAKEFNTELPSEAGVGSRRRCATSGRPGSSTTWSSSSTTPTTSHPALAEGIRRGDKLRRRDAGRRRRGHADRLRRGHRRQQPDQHHGRRRRPSTPTSPPTRTGTSGCPTWRGRSR